MEPDFSDMSATTHISTEVDLETTTKELPDVLLLGSNNIIDISSDECTDSDDVLVESIHESSIAVVDITSIYYDSEGWLVCYLVTFKFYHSIFI